MISNWLPRLYRQYCVLTSWNIGVVDVLPGGIEALVCRGQLGPIRWCPRPCALSSRADAFLWPLAGEPRVIYEEIDHWQQGRGHISSVEWRALHELQAPRSEIVQPFH